MSYVNYDDVNPLSSQTGLALPITINANEDALRDGLIVGSTGGFTLSVSGGTAEEPAVRLWSNGTLRERHTITYTGGYPTSILCEFSSNSGSSYSTMWTQTATYDGSGNMTAGNNQNAAAWLYEWIGKFKALRTTVNAFIASTYNAAAVAITGGTIAGVGIATSTLDSSPIGATTPALGTFLSAREKHLSVAFGGATTTLDLATAASFSFTATSSGAAALTFSNFPASGILVTARVEITNGGLRTWTWTNGQWGAGTPPTLSSSGKDIIFMQSRDGGTTRTFSVQDLAFS